MHTQTGVCGTSMCSSIMSSIFSMIIFYEVKEFLPLLAKVPKGQLAQDPKDVTGQIEMLQYDWYSAIISLVLSCCIGSCLVFLARNAIETRNGGCLRAFCIIEGICSAYQCCQAMCVVAGLVSLSILLAAFSDTSKVCNSALQQMVHDGAFHTITVTTTQGSMTNPDYANCIKAIDSMKQVAYIFAAQLALTTCLGCAMAALCGSGSRFADDTDRAIEEEEFGMSGMEPQMLQDEDYDNDYENPYY